jgi:hypothetical protein
LRLLGRLRTMLERLAPYQHARELVDISQRDRERKKRQRQDRWRRLREAENTVRAVEYQYRAAARIDDHGRGIEEYAP